MNGNGPVDAELFARTAPAWNCVDYPGDGMHYTPDGDCVWCGMTREQIAAEIPAGEPLEDCTVCGRPIFEGQRVQDYAGCTAHYGCVPA